MYKIQRHRINKKFDLSSERFFIYLNETFYYY